ncbi:MAG: hypothetical protein OEY30_03380 [Candidatus Bathyarchaeota archaeon]|nr:hypothetical protein [Candidatus Bathyarchaeota archaeon]
MERVARYFLHGILFAVLYILLFLIWIFVFAILISVGFIIGFLLGLGLLFFMTGYINKHLGLYLWNIESETGFWGTLFHGLALFLVLLVVNLIVSTLPNLIFPRIETALITFIISAFLNGIIGKEVASWFGEVHVTGTG